MRDALSELAQINSQASAHLRETLEHHGIRSGYGTAKLNARATVYFAAFHPEETCLRFPPLTVRFFQDAVKFNVFTNAEAQEISFQAALCCQRYGQEYRGAFSSNLSSGIFAEFLNGALTRNNFLYKESVYGWCVDAFAAQMPWPLIPDFHLSLTGYRPARVSKQGMLGTEEEPFLRFVNSVDIAAMGACGGLSVNGVMQALSWLQEQDVGGKPTDVALPLEGNPQRLIIPVFSYGFQGIVFGLFTGLEAAQKEPVLKTLVQFGQSLSDTYASLRRNDCLQLLKQDRDAGTIASAFLKLFSPVEHLVVEKDGRFCSHSLEREDKYWAKYRKLTGFAAKELGQELEHSGQCYKVEQAYMGDRFKFIVQPVRDSESLGPVFTWLSLKARLVETLNVSGDTVKGVPLTLAVLSSLKSALEDRIALRDDISQRSWGDLGRLKRLCIVELIMENFERGEIELTNQILRSKMEAKLGPLASERLSGYQIAGRALERVKNEFSEDFRRSLKFEAVAPKKVRLRWTPQ